MKMLLKINIMLQDDLVDTPKIINNKVSSNKSSNSKTYDDVNTFGFVKDLVERKYFEDNTSISNLIKYVKESQIRDFYKRIINLINMNVENSSNVQYQKLQIEDTILKEKYSILDSLRIPLIPNVMSIILHEIFKYFEQFPKTNILSINNFCGTESTVISIPK